MALEKREPLPVGRYWVDAFGDDAVDALTAWTARNAGNINVEQEQRSPGEAGPFTNPVPSMFLLWEVKKPTPWGLKFSWPTRAGADVKSQTDTVQRPEPEHIPTLEETAKHVMFTAAVFGIVAIGMVWAGRKMLSQAVGTRRHA